MSQPTMSRAGFLRLLGGGLASATMGGALAAAQRAGGAAAGGFDFWFTRLKYNSGDWDVDQRMPANLLTSLVDYTTLRIDPEERVVALSDPRMLSAPFCYLAGHKAVEFSDAERRNFERYIRNGGFIFVDDCNHDIDGLFAKSFEYHNRCENLQTRDRKPPQRISYSGFYQRVPLFSSERRILYHQQQ